MSTRKPTMPRPGTQEDRILKVLMDGRVHTMYDWPRDDVYTGRNAVSRLKILKGWPIKSWKEKGHKVQRYQLDLGQLELPLSAAGDTTRLRFRRGDGQGTATGVVCESA